jgi:hypothetical protein
LADERILRDWEPPADWEAFSCAFFTPPRRCSHGACQNVSTVSAILFVEPDEQDRDGVVTVAVCDSHYGLLMQFALETIRTIERSEA